MTEVRMLFYAGVIFMLCITLLITHCTYAESACKDNAMKANVPAEKIKMVCSTNR